MVHLQVGALDKKVASGEREGEGVRMLVVPHMGEEGAKWRQRDHGEVGERPGEGSVLESRGKGGSRRTGWSTSSENCWEVDKMGLEGVSGI